MLSETVAITAIAAAYLAGLGLFWWYWRRMKRARHERDSTFVTTLQNGVINGTICTLDDVNVFYAAYFDAPQLSYRDAERLGLFLRKLLLGPSLPSHVSSTAPLERLVPVVRELIAAHDSAMEDVRKELPFSGTPSPERELLQDISALATGERSRLDSKLTELAKAVRIRQEMIERISDERGRSLRWAKWGAIGTVLFSLVSIILGAWALARG